MKKPNLRQLRAGGRSVILTSLLLVALILINLGLGALPSTLTRYDATAEQLYSLSEQTKTVLGKLDSTVDIYWLAKTGEAGEDGQILGPLLDRYASVSSKVQIHTKDPEVDPGFVKKYTEEEVSNNSLIVECGNRGQYIPYNEIFVTDFMALLSGTMKTDFEGEAVLTKAIVYVTNDVLPKIYNLTGHGEVKLPTVFSNAVQRQSMEIEDLSLASAGAIPTDASCVLVNAPTKDINEKELEMLKSYLKNGGSLFYIAGPTKDSWPNWDALMQSYYVTTQECIVVEGNPNYYMKADNQPIPTMLLPALSAHDVTNPLLDGGYRVVMNYSKCLVPVYERPETVRITELLKTSATAYVMSLDGETLEGDEYTAPFSVALAITDTQTDTNVIYVASAFLLDETLDNSVTGGNQDFFVNGLSWLSDYEDGISIHAKSMKTEFLTIPSSSATAFTIVILGLIPVSYLAIGAAVMIRRKRR